MRETSCVILSRLAHASRSHESRITHHASRITNHASRITHHESRITHHASRFILPPSSTYNLHPPRGLLPWFMFGFFLTTTLATTRKPRTGGGLGGDYR